jgi:hypothetical protein
MMSRSQKAAVIRDRDIRQALRSSLCLEHFGDRETRIVEELGLCEGQARIDVAVINGKFKGFEIKSEQDTLDRLPRQVDAYSRILDEVTVVASERHAAALKRLVPSWWGITLVHHEDGRLAFEQQRGVSQNPGPDSHALVQLLWRSEALQILEQLQLAEGLHRKPRRLIWAQLANELPWEKLHEVVAEKLKSRKGWRAVVP